ncbi:ERF family protein [Priestia megaterium]|uniref:ERF family protein n=1 Tax=Priestia megaterium TaxID=1404 RepID=UPI002E23CB3A|nr:ERF family protein [Priestia megaterium]
MTNIYQKLVAIRKTIDAFTKDSESFGYSYVSGSQVLHKIKDKMDELEVVLMPQVLNQHHETFDYVAKGKEKTDFIVTGDMKYVWVNAENPEDKIEIPWQFMGQQDDISKAFGSGLTYSERYFLLKFFGVPTDSDDPDGKDTSGKQGYSKPNSSNNSNGSLASEKQLNLVKSLLKKKVTGEWTFEKLHQGLKQKLNTTVDMENWTKSQASQAIEILQSDKKDAAS